MADTTKISRREWLRYIERLRKLNDKAADSVKEYVSNNGGTANVDRQSLIDYAYGVATKYGEGAATLSAEMYDAVAMLEGKNIKNAVPADTPSYSDVAKTVNGILKQSANEEMLSSGVGRLVKRTGIDTVVNNALRDGAEWAWIPVGDTCPFCIMLASQGWVKASKKAIKNGHAEHIHANCDCTYAVRFDSNLEVEGYNPDEYRKIYYGAEGRTGNEKLNSIRRMLYAEHKDGTDAVLNGIDEFVASVVTNRKEAYESLEKTFGDISDNVKNINEQLLVDNVNQLNALNARFKCLSADNIGYFTASPSGRAMAWTATAYEENGQRTNLSLVARYYKNADSLIKLEQDGRTSFFSMPFTDEYAKVVTITHEYGHILEAKISRDRTNWTEINSKLAKMYQPSASQKRSVLKNEEVAQAKAIYNEIIGIAKKNNPNFSLKDNLSKYGHTNYYEFFAECFANSQCGAPNELGKAMIEWLEKEGY